MGAIGSTFVAVTILASMFGSANGTVMTTPIWSALLALTGSYSQLVAYATFMFWVLYGVTVGGLIVLRRTRPAVPRPYRMFGYPITAVVFIVIAGSIAIFAFISAPLTSARLFLLNPLEFKG